MNINQRILGAVIGATLIGLASTADACTITSISTGFNPGGGINGSTWIKVSCTDSTWYGAWGLYSNDMNIQNVLAKVLTAKVLGTTVSPNGPPFNWNSTDFNEP